ncbi:hypothetical protein CPB84DRAFT_826749 [Gymnopilus junonius]|uniref:Ubiquitin 3 binding protein But2 C-terminal domain-containing protein n=1 Tax=Gymnopilus junonius TaxID=109634 RepID=A0A9P5TER3_GYMJU|nr:hypothetical protein CPB84DRAFT_826749 [Gymnopilus junonius]
MSNYQLLPVDDGPRRLEDIGSDANSTNDKLSWAAIFVCAFCTIINILVTIRSSSGSSYTFPSATSFLTTRGMTRQDIDSLRRPSQFIGLDKIHRNATSGSTSFVNFPLLMAQIDAQRPYEVTKPRKGEETSIGTVYPELGQMIATSSISTILQFRALDYGMELCELSIKTPDEEPVYPFILPSPPIQIYAIPQKKRLYANSLSYANRPVRGELIGEPRLLRNGTWSYTFRCSMDEIYTFEVACKNTETEECILRWTQDKEHESFPAIFVTQFSTI